MPEANLSTNSEVKKEDLDKLERLLQENLKSSAEVLLAVKEIKKYIRWQELWSAFRFFIIAIPIILGFIYLPPIIKEALEYYKSLLLN